MYRFMRRKCQEKNDNEVEKVATTSSLDSRPLAPRRSQHVMRVKKRDHQSGESIVPAVRENSRPQIFPKQREQTEQRAEFCQEEHCARSFIPMRNSKHNR